ncbi:MAG TPA: MotA/TolQ/ExbB proton channel family protein [Waddliaceae bacterium]
MKLFPILASEMTRLDLYQVYKASPLIYSILFALSLFAFVVWFYSFFTVRIATLIPSDFTQHIRGLLIEGKYDAALVSCQKTKHLTGNVLASGLLAREHGHQVMIAAMQTEGKRCGVTLWQRISLINDVAIIAPMLGLLGTVLGLFYAFYDVNRSSDTLASIFDGLGIAVGTTVAGLIVAILAMMFYATLKFRVIRLLTTLENETLALGNLIQAI